MYEALLLVALGAPAPFLERPPVAIKPGSYLMRRGNWGSWRLAHFNARGDCHIDWGSYSESCPGQYWWHGTWRCEGGVLYVDEEHVSVDDDGTIYTQREKWSVKLLTPMKGEGGFLLGLGGEK